LLSFCREKAEFNRIELTLNDTVSSKGFYHFLYRYNIDLYGDSLPEMYFNFFHYFSPMGAGANNNIYIDSYEDFKFATELLNYKQFHCKQGYPPIDSLISKTGAKLYEFGDSISALDLNFQPFVYITSFSGPSIPWSAEYSICQCLDVWLGARNKYVVFYNSERGLIGYLEISVLDYTEMIIHRIVAEKGDVIKIE
jgi:hypothetical protein